MINVNKKIERGEFFHEMREVLFNYLQDDLSRVLFQDRLLCSVGNSSALVHHASPFIREVVKLISQTPPPNWIFNYNTNIDIPKNETIIIFGVNKAGKSCFENVSKFCKDVVFCDTDINEDIIQINYNIKDFCGKRVITPSELLENYKDCPIIVPNHEKHIEIFDFLNDNNLKVLRGKKPIIFYGISELADLDARGTLCLNHKVLFVDTTKTLEKHLNCDIITLDELQKNHRESVICISTCLDMQKNYDFLKQKQFENVFFRTVHDHEGQYFDECIKLSENEIFLDCGVLDGLTSVTFAKKCNNKYKKIIMCEPNQECFELINKNTENLENIELKEIGVWNEKNTLKFKAASLNPGASRITDDGEISIEVDSIDNILNGDEVTFIKMDIEGAELNALKGASETIKKYKPKLAISIYHKYEDIIEIPTFIKSLVPEYKMYIRHYSNALAETVLYAVL